MRLSTPRLAITVAAIGTAAVTTSVAFAAAGPDSAPVTKAGAPTADAYSHRSGGVSASSTLSYWTPERMRAAKPVPLPKTVTPTSASSNYAEPASAAQADVPAAPVGGSVVTSGNVSTAAVTNAKQWGNTGSGIARTTGRLFFTIGGQDFICSATVVNAPNKHSVWTAAHCLREEGPNGRWASKAMFAPGYRDGKYPLGRYTVDWMKVSPQWANSTNRNYRFSFDLAAFTVFPAGGKQIQARTGAQGLAWKYSGRKYFVRAFGYPWVFAPSGKPTQRHRLYYCTGTTKAISFHPNAPASMTLPCTMGGGASGGPWLHGMNSKGWGKVMGVNSTHFTNNNRMNSPYQGQVAVDIYNFIKNK